MRPFHRPFLPQESLSATTKGHQNTEGEYRYSRAKHTTTTDLLQPFIHIDSSRSKHGISTDSRVSLASKLTSPNQNVVETTRKIRGHTSHKGDMEGAASGARTAAAGLSVPAAVPIDKGQLFPTRGAARTAAETELAAAGRAIKNGSSSERVTFGGICSGVTARASGMQLHCCRDTQYPLKINTGTSGS